MRAAGACRRRRSRRHRCRHPQHARMTAAAARSMSSRRASISRSRSTAGSTKPCGRRRRCCRGFRDTRRSTARPRTIATDVLVWYSPTAMHFGIRAIAPAGAVRATLADRDRIQSDDHVIIFLSTYNDGRQALVFGVNPLGVQLDGALAEGTRGTGGGFTGLSTGRETPDLSPDFVFQSKGRVTDGRLRSRGPHSVQEPALPVAAAAGLGHSRHARRAAPGHRGQLGAGQARRGVVPRAVGTLEEPHRSAPRPGARSQSDRHRKARWAADPSGGWNYDASRPEFGMNLRWGITPNLTMNGTVNPDFSQVESDAGQFSFDPRQALFFPEKRPFFLDGIEQFATPNNLIYTRRVVAPHRRDEDHRQGQRPHQPRLPRCGGRRGAVGDRGRSSGLQHPARAARRRREVARRARLHRSHRRRSIESRHRHPTRASSGRTSTA